MSTHAAIIVSISSFTIGLFVHVLIVGRWSGRVDSTLTTLIKSITDLTAVLEDRRKQWNDVNNTVLGQAGDIRELRDDSRDIKIRIDRLETRLLFRDSK